MTHTDCLSPCCFVIRKTLFSDDWEESWDSIVDGLRDDANTGSSSCMVKNG